MAKLVTCNSLQKGSSSYVRISRSLQKLMPERPSTFRIQISTYLEEFFSYLVSVMSVSQPDNCKAKTRKGQPISFEWNLPETKQKKMVDLMHGV